MDVREKITELEKWKSRKEIADLIGITYSYLTSKINLFSRFKPSECRKINELYSKYCEKEN